MPELTREEKLKLVEKLPQQLQDFLYSEDTGAVLLYFGKKYNLPDEKISALSKIVADVILGITSITSLAQEIVNKVTPDSQIAMAIAQELNSELLMPALMPTLPTRQEQEMAVGTPTPAERGVGAAPIPVAPRADQYREPREPVAEGPAPQLPGPEIIDLRKTPPPPMPAPVAAAPIPPLPVRSFSEGGPTLKPLTITKPIERPLIEAEPHKVAAPPAPPALQKDLPRPQYIIRPPGLAPTDLPHDVLDLRKDKGEF